MGRRCWSQILLILLAPFLCNAAAKRAVAQDFFDSVAESQTPTDVPINDSQRTEAAGSLAMARSAESRPDYWSATAQDTQESPADRTQPASQEKTEVSVSDLEKRLKEIEAELKKAKDAEQKKKDEAAGKPDVKPRGRLHVDGGWFHQSEANRAAVGDIQDGAYIRRARLGFDAKAFEVTEYRLDFEMGFGGGRPSIFDAYGRITHLPWMGNLQIGHFREPFSLEAQTSSNWLTFIERSINNTFDPSRNLGIMVFDTSEDESATWAIGAFREGSDAFGDDVGDAGESAVTGRVTWLPYWDDPSDGRYFWEVGASYSYRDPDNRFIVGPGGPEEAIVRYFGFPEELVGEDNVSRVPAFIQVAFPDATGVQLVGFETTWNLGALNIQSEYIGSYVDRFLAPSVFVHGAYIQASYFLTGEHRVFDRKIGAFGRMKVFENFFRVRTKDCCICAGRGAWEVACRWNYLDFSDENISAGYMDTSGLGLNWYLSPYMRMMFDYNFVDLHDPVDGRSDCQVFATRLDVHF